MTDDKKSINDLLFSLKERNKELNCLYEVEEVFRRDDAPMDMILDGIVHAIPPGWQHPEICVARITVGGHTVLSPNFRESPWLLQADLVIQDVRIGDICVFYTEERPAADQGPFLKEERKLLRTIADRLEQRILHERLKTVFEAQKKVQSKKKGRYWIILDLLKKTDTKLLTHVTRKMLNSLSWSGIEEANRLLEQFNPGSQTEPSDLLQEMNRPLRARASENFNAIADDVFFLAEKHLGERVVINSIQKWITEDRSNFLVKILEDPGSSLAQLTSAIERFHTLVPQGLELSPSREKGFRVSIIRKLLNDDPNFINIAKNVLELNDFYELLHHIIFPSGSYGKLGGKAAGLFLAEKILEKRTREFPQLRDIKVPKTWYLTSDGILNFISHNNLEDLIEQKYEDLAQVRREYPYVVHVFKNSSLPPEIVNGLSAALDDFGDSPLIVRSSSLLEDRLGASFAGKYKSLFIANQGTKRERLLGLMDAIAEVYASTFSPDPIEYRIEHGIIDFNEEMGILIQEVVGNKIGHYFLPAFAGVAFANNEFRWSPRIRREDGLLRMVPGLGTRAVDRLADDYPVLVSPGQPNLRVNVTMDEKVHYSPKKIDVINLQTNSFETIEIRELLRQYGDEYPMIQQLTSVLHNDRLVRPGGLASDYTKEQHVMTFDGLIESTSFIDTARAMLSALQQEFGTPVDLEFAHDGISLYLLQCRPQSFSRDSHPALIPDNISRDALLFTANRTVTNGTIQNITHIVYVDPIAYGDIPNKADLLSVGRAVSRLNQILPKRRFVLMGPGRWGSRGDIKLGVSVSYSDIRNTAMLIEIAQKRNGYMPELSFGTHFFQDLVEADIRYLPLYPDDPRTDFNEVFLNGSRNMLPDLLPEFAALAKVVRVIDVAQATGGKLLQVLMNGEREEAVGMFADYAEEITTEQSSFVGKKAFDPLDQSHSRWRRMMAERLAAHLDAKRFGVKAIYLFGNVEEGTAGPQSDIDLLVHFSGTAGQKKELLAWLEGWSLSLSESNYQRTGYPTERMLDVHFMSDEDVANRAGMAAKIGAVSDAPRLLTTPLPPSLKTGGGNR